MHAMQVLFSLPDQELLMKTTNRDGSFTSGNIEKVWDGEPGQNSPFAAFLINTLRHNLRPKLRASDLIHQVSLKVSRNTRQTPIGSALDLVGDEGGVFVFYRK